MPFTAPEICQGTSATGSPRRITMHAGLSETSRDYGLRLLHNHLMTQHRDRRHASLSWGRPGNGDCTAPLTQGHPGKADALRINLTNPRGRSCRYMDTCMWAPHVTHRIRHKRLLEDRSAGRTCKRLNCTATLLHERNGTHG